MHFGSNQRWQHSIWCHLHTGGGHHQGLCFIRAHTPWRCAEVFGNGIGCVVSFCRWHASNRVRGSSKWQLCMRKLLKLGLLPPMWGPIWGQWMENLQVSNIQSQIGKGTPNTTLVIATWVGIPCANCKSILGILQMMGLWQLMEDLCWEVALRELTAPQRDPPPKPGGNPVGNGDPDVDDQEVTFPNRGRVGTCRSTNSTPCSHTTRWRLGTQRTTSSPPAPTQPNEDVGCLINTLAMGLQLGTPHINTFSGKAMPGKMEMLFKQWYHEVQRVKDHYQESVGRESIIHSVKGASIAHILQKLSYFWHCSIIWHSHAKLQ